MSFVLTPKNGCSFVTELAFEKGWRVSLEVSSSVLCLSPEQRQCAFFQKTSVAFLFRASLIWRRVTHNHVWTSIVLKKSNPLCAETPNLLRIWPLQDRTNGSPTTSLVTSSGLSTTLASTKTARCKRMNGLSSCTSPPHGSLTTMARRSSDRITRRTASMWQVSHLSECNLNDWRLEKVASGFVLCTDVNGLV